ncbi:hypothetical protein [Phycicoccus avicenniae]|uniref:hypothetical protein n=1 Tax=Phycicoccus avicenniae TaxID=2828860 RepID=UPI003D2AAF18
MSFVKTSGSAEAFLGVALGSWPDWLAAVFTSFAFSIAALTYLRSARERRQAQARLVYAKITAYRTFEPGQMVPLPEGLGTGVPQPGAVHNLVSPAGGGGVALTWVAATRVVRVVVELHNASDELVLRWLPRLYDYGLRLEYDITSTPLGVVEPHSHSSVILVANNPHAQGEPGLNVNLTIEDSSGQTWERLQSRPIRRITRRARASQWA